MNELINELSNSLKTSFIDFNEESLEEFRPKLLLNNYKKGSKIISHLLKELEECEEFYFSVAFINNSGLNLFLNAFKELEERGIKGKIITTNYLNFNEPSALRRLLKFKNIEVKVFDEGNFHTKGYIFKKKSDYTLIVGSSNITAGALTKNEEWNLKVTSLENGELLIDIKNEFEELFNRSNILTEEWIKNYEIVYKELKKKKITDNIKFINVKDIKPNAMQKEALMSLQNNRDNALDKSLIISATATGKTYLSAFDVKNFNPKKMLFIVHREQIAKKALQSYREIFDVKKSMGILSGTSKEIDCDFIFSTMQTLSKTENLEMFSRDHFDYIIIDEVHRAGATSYRKIIDYFNPKFMLGMTATPERTDGFNIYELFDYNIAYEIRLQKALEEDMLCPFNYYGVSEIIVDGNILNEETNFSSLVSEERVRNITEKADFYGFSGERVKGLIFCSRNDEAKELSEKFNELGFSTVSLTGSNTQEEREDAIKRLEQDDENNKLDYIFSVDIFNEGVDIPKINQVIMLRATQSAIVFVQQLGRGLRKHNSKDYVVVIDFIGNYKTNFLIPVALFEDKTYNKDNIRRIVSEGNNIIPGSSSIMFEKVVKKRIYDSINETNFSNLKNLKESYNELKNKIGRMPMLIDFKKYGNIDVDLILNYKKSYYNFLVHSVKEIDDTLNEKQKIILEFISIELANSKRIHEFIILNEILTKGYTSVDEISFILEEYGIINDYDSIKSAISILNNGFITNKDLEKYKFCNFIKFENDIIKISDNLKSNLNSDLNKYLLDLIEYSIYNYKENYTNRYENKNLVLYKKYSRKDVCRLLNWEKDESSTVYGYRIKHNTCPIFVTYHKSNDISSSTKYEDKFISKSVFSWMTRSNKNIESSEVVEILNYESSNLKIELFVKKEDGEGTDFYYLGSVMPIHVSETTITNDKEERLPIVNIKYKLNTVIRDDIYDYLSK